MFPITAPTLSGSCVKPNVVTNAIMKATVRAPAKLPRNTRPQFRSTPFSVTPGRLSISASGVSTNTPVKQIESQQIQHAESDRKQQRTNERLAGIAR